MIEESPRVTRMVSLTLGRLCLRLILLSLLEEGVAVAVVAVPLKLKTI
jgi:hypothetical protein